MTMNSVSCITTVSVGDDVVSYKGYQVKHIAAESRDCETLFVHFAIDIVVKKSDATVLDSEVLHVSAHGACTTGTCLHCNWQGQATNNIEIVAQDLV